jgi:hypothetical protein
MLWKTVLHVGGWAKPVMQANFRAIVIFTEAFNADAPPSRFFGPWPRFCALGVGICRRHRENAATGL